jgi:hypothetical protein
MNANAPQPPAPPEMPGAQPERETKRSGCFWGLAGATGCLLLLIIPFIAALLLGVTTVTGLRDSVVGIFNPRPESATSLSSQTIVQGIQPMGQLVSISAQLAKADIFIGIQQGALNACGFGANHVAQGTVEAGIDLMQVGESDVSYNQTTDTFTLTLPPAQLTSCRIDFIRQYDTTTTACSVDWDEARVLASHTALLEFRDDAVEGGILNRAEQQASLVLGDFVQLLTGSSVEVEFAPADANALPPSCQPETPSGWAYDPATRAWTTP